MSADNKVELKGFAGSDPELKKLDNNRSLAKFSLAVHDNYRNSTGEEVKHTNWIYLVFWNAKADEAAQQIKKGSRIQVTGRLSTQSYETSEGVKRYTMDVVVQEFQVLSTAAE